MNSSIWDEAEKEYLEETKPSISFRQGHEPNFAKQSIQQNVVSEDNQKPKMIPFQIQPDLNQPQQTKSNSRYEFIDESTQKNKQEKNDIWDIAEQEFLQQDQISPEKQREEDLKIINGEDFDLEREIERNIAQQSSRMGETILGIPGDLEYFSRWLIGNEGENLLPTSSKLREKSEKASLGYTKPKNNFEEKTGQILSDIATFSVPGAGKHSLVRNIGIPIAGHLAEEGFKFAGYGEKAQVGSRIGTMIILDLIGHRFGMGGSKKLANELFKKAESEIKPGMMIPAKGLESGIDSIEKALRAGGTKPSTPQALTKIEEIRSHIKNGQIDAKDLVPFRQSINEVIEGTGGWDLLLQPGLKSKIKNNLNDVKKEVIKAAEQVGETNPEFVKNWRAANEAFAANARSEKIENMLEKVIGRGKANKITSGAIKALPGLLFGVFTPAHFATLGLGIPAYQAIKLGSKIKNSPTIRRHYEKMIKGALTGNTLITTKEFNKINEEIEEKLKE